MSHFEFLKQSLQNLKTIGTVTRTSDYACRALTGLLNFNEINILVELGAGDGAITRHILQKLHADAKLIVFEVNEHFINKLNELDDPRLIIVNESAETMSTFLKEHGIKQVDAIISAIPFMLLPDELTYTILKSCKKHLKPGASFIQIHYSLTKKKLYKSLFGNVDVVFVPFNIPPLFAIHSVKEGDRVESQ
jgi:phospholipid N-methyltransferase